MDEELISLPASWNGHDISMGKYEAGTVPMMREMVSRLDGLDKRAGEWARWMVWWHAFRMQQVETRCKIMEEQTLKLVSAEAEISALRAEVRAWRDQEREGVRE